MVHKHKSPVARIGCARVKKSIMYLTMHKQKSTRQPIVPQQSTQNTQFEHCQPTSEKNQGFSWLSPAGALGYRPQKLCLGSCISSFTWLFIEELIILFPQLNRQFVSSFGTQNLEYLSCICLATGDVHCYFSADIWLTITFRWVTIDLLERSMWSELSCHWLLTDWRASFWFKVSFDKSFINIFLDWSRLHLIQ